MLTQELQTWMLLFLIDSEQASESFDITGQLHHMTLQNLLFPIKIDVFFKEQK